ncbi:hypothetical protein CC86DRAFT_304980 [Ophiobolus disseminans]|uniref:Uncharacterized protein n=1 Tax=Ophiobolus disseminans TaxID=1469910 RepID=A0A6A6ZIT6_9PLEO|nr:hypothetical protein CC86DRAFT_304980 [Ophiobolus disseminans]
MADFIGRLLRRVDELNVATFVPDKGAQDDFNEQVEDFMVGAVWSGTCTSWCKLISSCFLFSSVLLQNGQGQSGKVTAVWPGSSLHYREVLEQNRWEDWNWTYPAGRYKIWGSGKSAIEKSGGDHSYYLQHGSFLPCRGVGTAHMQEELKD